MNEDLRCCGSDTCIIDVEGRCWCGRQWDGEKLCLPASDSPSEATAPDPTDQDQ